MLIQKFAESGLIAPPEWLPPNTMFVANMGSVAFGSSEDDSDRDVHGFCVPPKDVVFPNLAGFIPGFGTQPKPFELWSQHHVRDPDGREVEYDFSIFSIVRFVHLAGIHNNPNALDILFAPARCVLHTTPLAEHLRDHRREFLHKGSMDRLRGYAAQQFTKIRNRMSQSNPKRKALIDDHGYDTKYAMHVVRLVLQAEQILTEHDLRVDRNGAVLKEVRNGGWSLERLEQWFETIQRALELKCAESTLRETPNEPLIRRVLIECLEMHYGSLDVVVAKDKTAAALVRDLREVLQRYE